MQVGKKVNKNNICNLRKRTKYWSYQDTLGNLCVCVRSVMSDSSRPHRLQPTRFLRPQDSPGKNTGVGCHFLLQGTFSTHGVISSLSEIITRYFMPQTFH